MPVVIVRHAQSAANAGGRTGDPAAIGITETGVLQARFVAGLIPQKPSLIAVSRYPRTAQTSAALLERFPETPVECWPIEEFTYLNIAACAGTTYAERKALRDVYWTRCDPEWVDGPGCECFAEFVARARNFVQALGTRDANETLVVFTHGLFMQMLLWLQHCDGPGVNGAEMAAFDKVRCSVFVPNCAVLRSVANTEGFRLSPDVSLDHLPANLRTG